MELEKVISAAAWPVVVLLLGLVCLALFYTPIHSFLSKVRSINAAGLKAEIPPEIQRDDSEKRNQEAVHQLLLGVSETPALTELDAKIRHDLVSRGLNVDGDVPKILIRYLASAGLLLQFEQIHALIFGSQITLLKKLNEVRGVGRPVAFVQAHIADAKTQHQPIREWSDKQYMEFLVGRALVGHNDAGVFITNLGIEYLTWMVRMGRSENKQN